MGRGMILVLACILAVACAACNSVSTTSGLSADVTSVRVTRDPGLLVMPPLDRTITDGKTARRLAGDILTLSPFPSGNYACPADFGTTYKLVFAGTMPWSAVVETAGCRGVQLSNRRNLMALTSTSLYADLASALGLKSADLAPVPCTTSTETRCYPQPESGKGLITGGIKPCQGVISPNAPRYAAGTVTVLKGAVAAQGSAGPMLPQTVVTTQRVGVNETFLLALDPGDYVLRAQFPPPANVMPYVSITVTARVATEVDIPNGCK